MRRIMIVLLIGLMSLLVVVSISCKHELTKEEIAMAKELNIPIYDGAQNVHFVNRGEEVHGVYYKLTIPYGSMEVLEFYNSKMEQLGYKPFVEEYYKYGDRNWQTFIDGTKKGTPYVAQLHASWTDAKQSRRAILALRYYLYGEHDNPEFILGKNYDLTVDFQYLPFSIFPPPSRR